MHPPSLDLDPFDDAAIREPHCGYRTIRDAGPAVWLERHGVWALGRYADARAALVGRVRRIEVGRPREPMSNMPCGYEGLDAAFH